METTIIANKLLRAVTFIRAVPNGYIQMAFVSYDERVYGYD